MQPPVTIVTGAILSAYLYPDNIEPTALIDWELGGIGLSNGTQGLQVQAWELQVLGSGSGTAVYVSSPNTPSTQLFALSNISWARLAFDQNMHPIVSYVSLGSPGFYWYDPTIPGNTFTSLPSTVITPCVTMDDKRDLATRLGTNDVVMCYINNNNLCYRLQRERYGTEHVWLSNINTLVTNPIVNRIGMGAGLRLQIEVQGALYQ